MDADTGNVAAGDAGDDRPVPADLPAPLRRAAALVGVEGVGLVLLGVGYAVSGVVGAPEDRAGTVLAGALAVLLGLALLPVARALAAARGWALSPAVVVQVLVAVVGIGLLQGGVVVVGLPLLLLAGLVLHLLFTPDARTLLRG